MSTTERLKQPLERLYREFDYQGRLAYDAIQFPGRYPDPRDREVVALLSACLAYGRVDLFSREVERLLAIMGPHPAGFIRAFDPAVDTQRFQGFRYRFNRPRDIAAFCLAVGRILDVHGSLRSYFLEGYSDTDPDIGPALERFVDGIVAKTFAPCFDAGPPGGSSTSSRAPRLAARASASSSFFVGWSAGATLISATGSRSRRPSF